MKKQFEAENKDGFTHIKPNLVLKKVGVYSLMDGLSWRFLPSFFRD